MVIMDAIIKPTLKYKNLGGKTIRLERELTAYDIENAGNWACWNFMDRRNDYADKKCFYGHAEDGLGYVVCEDELERIIPTKGKHFGL